MQLKVMRHCSLPAVIVRTPIHAIVLGLFVFWATATPAISQKTPQGIPQAPTTAPSTVGNIVVQVRGQDGSPLVNAFVKLYTDTLSPTNAVPLPRGSGFEFQGLASGRYVVEATATGFETGRQAVEFTGAGQNEVVMLFLKPVGAEGHTPYASGSTFPPKAQKEIQTALRDLESKKYDSARKHVNAALKAAPGNALVHYVMGMTYIVADRAPEARPELEKALTLDPRHLQSLTALGNLEFQQQNYTQAKELFDRALRVSPTSWQAQWMLAKTDLRLRNFSSAREHSERAFELDREKAVGAQLVTAEAMVGLKEYKQASRVLSAYLLARPKDPNAEKIQGWIAQLDRAVESAAATAPAVAASPVKTADAVPADPLPAAPSTRDSWAPPDADAVVPPVIPGVACNLSEVLALTAKRAEDLVTHLGQFSALEQYESVEIAPNGQVINQVSAAFNYLVFLRRIRPEQLAMEEVREQNRMTTRLPGSLQDLGSPSIVLVFHPIYQDDFEFKCEGLGQWNGQPTWLVHFRQRTDRPVRFRSFVSRQGVYPVRLRGRAWVAKDSYQVVHMETDLLEPVPEVQLRREHMSIDYQLVPFPESKVELWLPQQVDLYHDFRGRIYHHYHRFSDFRLFAVDVKQQIGAPAGKKSGSY